MRFSKGDLVKNTKAPAWGIGEVLDSLGYYVHVIFEEVDERRAFVREDNPLKKVDSPEGVANLKNKSRTKIYGGKSTEERVRRDKKNAQAAKNLADKELKSFSKVTFKPDITGHYLILAGLLIHLTQIIMLICKQFFMILFTLDGSRQGGVRGYWADEATEKTASKPKFREINLHLHKLIGLVYLTDELMEDSSALEAYVRQAFIDEINFKVDDAIIDVTGAGMPLGIKNAGCTIVQDKEVGQAAATIVYEDIVKMWARLLPNAKADAVWLINADCMPSLASMSVAVGSGGSAVYVSPGGASATPYGTLMNKPIIEIEQAETLGTQGV